MDAYEAQLKILLDNHDIVGVSTFVAIANGETLDSNNAGYQSLEPDATPLTSSSTFALYSGGKFVADIATLQLVEQGLASLDDPIYRILPELEQLPIIIATNDEPPLMGFSLVPRKRDMTLRHMLSNSSGISDDNNPLIKRWMETGGCYNFPQGTSPIVKLCTRPLLFEAGEGWCYGHDVHFLQVVIERLSGEEYVSYVTKNIFQALEMHKSAYIFGDAKRNHPVYQNWVQAVERDSDGSLRPCVRDMAYGITLSAEDVQKLFIDLISPDPRILKTQQSINEVFGSTLAKEGLTAFQGQAFEFAGSSASIPGGKVCQLVSYTCGGAMVIEQDGLQSPKDSLVWDGLLNVAWAVNRERGICMFFGSQLLPEYDEKTTGLMKLYFESAWASCSYQRPSAQNFFYERAK